MKGDLVLHLKPQPLPDPSVTSIDEDLDLTAEPEVVSGVEPHSGGAEDVSSVEEHQEKAREPPSKQVLKRLLNRIRTQKDQWGAKAETGDAVSDTLESGSLPMDNESADVIREEENKSAVDSNEVTDNTVLAGKSILLHPQEEALRIRMEAERRKKMEDLERQKQEQLELISKLEVERKSLEAQFHKMRLQVQDVEQESGATVQMAGLEPAVEDGPPEESAPAVAQLNTSAESLHIQMIREYQQRLIEQNRVHKQSVDEARKRLQDYQLLLKNRYPHLSTSHVGSPDQGQENTRSLQRPQPNLSEYNHPSDVLSSLPGANVFTSASLSDPGHSPSTEKQELGHSMSPGLIKRSPKNGVPYTQDLEPVPSSSEFHSVDSNQHFLEGRSPQGLLSHNEKLSSTSSPGEHDSSSGTSYFPLPSALSLGLPQDDFSEPSISFTVPEEQVSKRDHLPLGDFSNVQEFRERLVSSAAQIRNQQDHLKEMQAQLDEQRDSLLSKQQSQEQHLLHKQKELEEQLRRHQETLEKLIGSTEPRQGAVPDNLRMFPEGERYQFMSALLKALDDDEVSGVTDFESSNGSLMRPPGREQKWRPSRPPVTKTKLGPFLQQHELSAILEVETPSSGRRSSTGVSELKESHPGRNDRSGHGELVAHLPDISKMSSDSTLIHGDLSRLSASIRDETPNQSCAKLSWRETLSLEGSCDPTGGDHSLTPVLHQSLHEILTGNRNTLPKHLTMEDGAPGPGPTGQGRSPNSVSDYLSTTTLSSGSFLTSEKTDSSPVTSDILSDLQRCNYSAIEENRVINSSPSLATAEVPRATWSNYLSPVESRSHIQQIIDKYTKDLSASLERNLSFHSPAVASDISAADNNQSSTFHSLEPKPDFNISTPSYAQSAATSSPQTLQDLSQSSSNSSRPEQQSYRSPASHLPLSSLALSSSVGSFQSQNMGRMSARRQNGADGSFLPLQPEHTLNEPNVSSHEEPSCDGSGPEQDQENPLQHGVSQPLDAGHRAFASPHSSTILTSAAEESGSFHALMATQMTVNDSELSEHPISESLERNSVKSAHFEELPAVQEAAPNNNDPQDTDPGVDQAVSRTSDQSPESASMTHTSHSRSSLQSLSSFTIGSSAGSLQSFVRTWDSESMRGILEEPDLTLISLNDSSIVCSEPPVTLIADHQDGNTSQNIFHPLEPEVDASGLAPDQSAAGMSLSQHFAEMSLEFTSTPGSLQDAFLRKKKHFIENSAKRIQEIKQKDRFPKQEGETSNLSDVPVLLGDRRSSCEPALSDGGQLKKVVEVRVCTPEERKLSEIEMHQRTIRLYNRLGEVKTRKEEKMRQETYSKNREKAKEYKKRTLEKLRTKR